jgi:hypothetical protein
MIMPPSESGYTGSLIGFIARFGRFKMSILQLLPQNNTLPIIQRIWAMPSKNTYEVKPIKELLEREMTKGIWIDPFANNSKIAQITNDLNPNFNTDYNLEAVEFLRIFGDNTIDGVLLDPPYSPRQIKELYKSVGLDTQKGILTRSDYYSNIKNEIARIIKPSGKAICFGWNSQGVGKKRGFELTRVLLVPHGSSHNDTICTVERKLIHQQINFTTFQPVSTLNPIRG